MPEDTHAPLAGHPLAEEAVEAYLAAVAAVEPAPLVRRAVRQGRIDDWLGDRERPRRIHVLALGKAAPRMLWGLVEAGVPFTGIGVAPRGAQAPQVDGFRWRAGEHPAPGSGSFAAGREVLDWARALPDGAPVLILLSGGSSACVEVPAPGWDEARLVARWTDLMAAGLPVEEMNRRRAEMSALKGGGLARELLARTPNVRCWLVQDTAPGQPQAVGSEAVWAGDRIPIHVLASDRDLAAAAGLRLAARGWTVYRHAARIEGEAAAAAEAFLDALHGLPGERVALVGAGEPTVRLPAGAPPGGRSQHAALAAAVSLRRRGSPALFAAFASDGTDGGTDAAGAWVRAEDGGPEAEQALARFASHACLRGRRRLVHMGPTGTNVNDLWVGLRP